MGILDKDNEALELLSQEERMRAGDIQTKNEKAHGEKLDGGSKCSDGWVKDGANSSQW